MSVINTDWDVKLAQDLSETYISVSMVLKDCKQRKMVTVIGQLRFFVSRYVLFVSGA